MFVVDYVRAMADDCSDVIVDCRDYATNINQTPYSYTVPLSEKLMDISRVELLDRKVPYCPRYQFAIPLDINQSILQANLSVPALVYSAYDGSNLVRALIYRFDDFIDGTESGTTKKKVAYAVPVNGLLDPSFMGDTTNVTLVYQQEPYPGAGTTITYTRGLGDTDFTYLRTVHMNIELKLSFGPSTVFKQQNTKSVHHDTFWLFDQNMFFFLNNVNVNKYLKDRVNSDYIIVSLLEEDGPYIPSFTMDYTASPPNIEYEPHFFHFRLYFQRKFY